MRVSSQPRTSWRERRSASTAAVSVIVSAPRRMSILVWPRVAIGVLATVMILSGGLPASAGDLTSTVTDPAGDAPFRAPGFLDLLSASVSKSGQTFSFRMSMAAPIPAVPPRTPPGTSQVAWTWTLDTDPSTRPEGYPLPAAPGVSGPSEFIIAVAWDGNAFFGRLVDRRPLLTGGEAVLIPLAFTISGADVRMDVRASLLGNPSSFLWAAFSFYWSAPPGGTWGAHFVDGTEPFSNPFPS